MLGHQICALCVMDSSDPDFVLDLEGVCNYCRVAQSVEQRWRLGDDDSAIRSTIDRIKSVNGREYDCILGLSGGVDSSYLALKAHEWGLRPLVVHIDAGWNSEASVQNIQALVEYCDYELHTEVIDWGVMRRLQVAYLRSGVVNQDVPQDHAIFAGLYRFARENRVRYILSGFNAATEAVAVNWHGPAMDSRNIRAIFEVYGEGNLDGFPLVSFSDYYFAMPLLHRMRTLSPLDVIHYNREKAISELVERVGWKPYGRKHGESLWTRFYQNHYLPVRLGLDKRRPHLSSQIHSGQITRAAALELLDEPLYDPIELARDEDYIRKKLRLSQAEWDAFMQLPARSHMEFRNWGRQRGALKKAQTAVSRTLRKPIHIHG